MSEENITPETPTDEVNSTFRKSSSKMLHRSKTNSIIAGVCGGIGEYFDIDPTIVRIAFVLFTVFGGSGIIVYLLLWVVLPGSLEDVSTPTVRRENAVKEMRETAKTAAGSLQSHSGNDNATSWIAFVLVGLGAYFLLRNLGLTFSIFDLVSFKDILPIALIFGGIYLYYKRR